MADDGGAEVPAVEKRGGEKPDWANAKPGQELPERKDGPDPQPGADPG